MSEPIFDELAKLTSQGELSEAIQRVAERMREQRKYHELFDARLMAGRQRLGLPAILTSTLDELPEPQRTQIEDVYLEACREVGHLLLEAGRVREAWMYLRPLGEREQVAAALERIEPQEDLIEQLIEIALHEGVHPELGFRLVLEHYGTCNSISMFDGLMHDRPRAQQRAVVALLVRHLHAELAANLRADIVRREGTEPAAETSIHDLVATRPELFEEANYHIDTSHLGAVLRFARLTDDAEVLEQALDMIEYGQRLAEQYKYPGEEPFRDTYEAHRHFFSAQVGRNVDEAVEYFRHRADTLPLEEVGSGPAEVYVALLARVGRWDEAIAASLRLLPPGTPTARFAPSLFELSRLAGHYEPLVESSRERGDLLGYVAGMVQARQDAEAS